jgi:hypothetical protein
LSNQCVICPYDHQISRNIMFTNGHGLSRRWDVYTYGGEVVASGKQYPILKPAVPAPPGHPALVPFLESNQAQVIPKLRPLQTFYNSESRSHALATGPPPPCVLAIKTTCHRLPAESSSCPVIHVLGVPFNQATLSRGVGPTL